MTDSEERKLVQNSTEEDQEDQASLSTRQQIAGYTCALVYLFGTTISVACAQALGGIIPMFELNMWRYLAQFGVAAVAVAICQTSPKPQRKHIVWLVLAALLSALYNICLYTSSLYLPLGVVGGMTPSASLIVTYVITLVISRKCPLHIALAVVVCIVGILLTIQPDFIFQGTTQTGLYNPMCHFRETVRLNGSATQPTSNTIVQEPVFSYNITDFERGAEIPKQWIGYVYVMGTAIAASLYFFICNGKLYDLHPMTIAFWVGIGGTVMSLVPMAIFEDVVFPQTTLCHVLLFSHAFAQGLGVVLGTVPFQLFVPVKMAIIETLGVLLSFVAQYTVMEHINPGRDNALSFIGAATIILGNLIIPSFSLYKTIFQVE